MRKDPEGTPAKARPLGAGTNVIKFDRRRGGLKRRGPQIMDPLRRLEDEDERRRILQNLAAAILIILLIASGFWLIDHLRTTARIEACLEAGHRNCLPMPGQDR
jgi:hypothetical protein